MFAGAFSPPLIVGYAQSTLDNDYGAIMTGAQFFGIGSTEAIALSDIKPTATSTSAADLAGNVEIQTLNHAGYTVDSYVWNGEGWEGDEGTTFAPGTGLWVANLIGKSDTVGLQTSGKVGTSDVAVTLDADYGAVGVANPFPVQVALADLIPECATMSAADLAGNVAIQTLDHGGYTVDSYVWTGDGWDGDEGTTFAPGTGLWVFNYVRDSAVTLRIPAPGL